MKYFTSLSALALLSAAVLPRVAKAESAALEAEQDVTVTEDLFITVNAPMPAQTRIPISDPYNTSDIADLPRPLNDTIRSNLGLFRFNHSAPLNHSDFQSNGTYRNFTDGREFIFTPVEIDIEIEEDIEVNIIVQEFCEACTDRSDPNDFHVVTTTTTITDIEEDVVTSTSTSVYTTMSRELVAVTTTFTGPTVWTYNYAYRRTTREMVRTITAATEIVYWEYQYVVVTDAVDADTATTQVVTSTVTSSTSTVTSVITEATTVTDTENDVTITADGPTTITYEVVVPVTITETANVVVTRSRTQNVQDVTTTPTTAADDIVTSSLPAAFTSFEYIIIYVAETIYVGGITKVVPVTASLPPPVIVTVTQTVTSTATNGQVTTLTLTSTETRTASVSANNFAASTTTVIGGSPVVTSSPSTSAVPNTIVVFEIQTITIGDFPVTERCAVTKIARPSDVLRGVIHIRVTIVIEIFEFFFFVDNEKHTSTSTVTQTITVSDTTNGTSTGVGPTGGSRTTGGFNSNPTGGSNSSLITTNSTTLTTNTTTTTGGGGGGLTYDIDFTVITVIEGVFFGFCPCSSGNQVCGKPSSQLTLGPGTDTTTTVSESITEVFQFEVTETGVLVTTDLQIVFLEDLSNPCPVSFTSQSDETVITIIEQLNIVWVVNDDGSLSCFRNGIELVFFTCVEVAGEVSLFAGDATTFFDLSVCTEIVLTVNNVPGSKPKPPPIITIGTNSTTNTTTSTITNTPTGNGTTLVTNSTSTSNTSTSSTSSPSSSTFSTTTFTISVIADGFTEGLLFFFQSTLELIVSTTSSTLFSIVDGTLSDTSGDIFDFNAAFQANVVYGYPPSGPARRRVRRAVQNSSIDWTIGAGGEIFASIDGVNLNAFICESDGNEILELSTGILPDCTSVELFLVTSNSSSSNSTNLNTNTTSTSSTSSSAPTGVSNTTSTANMTTSSTPTSAPTGVTNSTSSGNTTTTGSPTTTGSGTGPTDPGNNSTTSSTSSSSSFSTTTTSTSTSSGSGPISTGDAGNTTDPGNNSSTIQRRAAARRKYQMERIRF